MAGKTLTTKEIKGIKTTTALRTLLAHNNKIDKDALSFLRNKGIATPSDVTSRCNTPLC
jgi:hypothetical protein